MNSTASRLADLAELLRDPTPEGRSALLACVTDLYVSGADDCSDDARDGFGLLLVDIARMAGADAQQVLARSIAHDEAPPATLVEAFSIFVFFWDATSNCGLGEDSFRHRF